MRLGNVKSVGFDVNDEWTKHTVARIVTEMKQEYAEMSKSWYVLNEATGEHELDQVLMEAGVKDFIMKGAAKVKQAAEKAGKAGKEAYDTIGAHLAKKLQNDMPEAFGKLTAYAGKHKMATAIIATIGASLMAMEPAAASAAMDAISQAPIDQVADAATQGADAGMQAPQMDPSPVYNQGGANPMVDKMKNVIGQQFLGAEIGGAKPEPADVAKAMNMIKIDGVQFDNYLSQAIDFAQEKGLSPKSLIDNIQGKVDNQMMDALYKVIKARQAGGA